MLKVQYKNLLRPALIVLVIDQVSKLFIVNTPHIKRVAIMPHLNFYLSYNRGAAFGLLGTASGWQRWAFIAIAVVISFFIFAWTKRLGKKDKWEIMALGLILGGAWGNLLDRIRLGYVVDFIDFYIRNWHWYTFNIADIAICIGAVLLAVVSLKQ